MIRPSRDQGPSAAVPPGNSALLNFAAGAGALYFFKSILWPLALAIVLVVLIDSLARRITSILPRAGRRTVFILTSVFIGAMAVTTALILIEGLYNVVVKLPDLQARIEALLEGLAYWTGGVVTLGDIAASIDVDAEIAGFLSALKDGTSGLVLTLLYLAFLLGSRRLIERRISLLSTQGRAQGLLAVVQSSVSAVEAYISIQTLTGIMIAGASAGVMIVTGLDNPVLWASIIFLFSYLPVVGVLLGSLGPTLFAVLQFPTAVEPLAIFLGIQATSFIVGNLVLPKMQADSQNIDPAAGLLAVGAWTIVWGAAGAFLAIPLTLAIMYALAQSPRLAWISILLSNDGSPMGEDKPLSVTPTPSRPERRVDI